MALHVGVKCGFDDTRREHLDGLFAAGLIDFLEFSMGADHDPREHRGDPVRAIHAQHFDSHGFNPVDSRERDRSLRLLDASSRAADILGAQYVIVHPERDVFSGTCALSHFAEVLERHGDPRVLVENMPSPGHFLVEPEEVRQFLAAAGTGFLLDIGHAAGAAFMTGNPLGPFLAELAALGPAHWHFADTPYVRRPDEPPYFYRDGHRHLGEGDIDWEGAVAPVLPEELWATLETPMDAGQAADALRVRELYAAGRA